MAEIIGTCCCGGGGICSQCGPAGLCGFKCPQKFWAVTASGFTGASCTVFNGTNLLTYIGSGGAECGTCAAYRIDLGGGASIILKYPSSGLFWDLLFKNGATTVTYRFDNSIGTPAGARCSDVRVFSLVSNVGCSAVPGSVTLTPNNSNPFDCGCPGPTNLICTFSGGATLLNGSHLVIWNPNNPFELNFGGAGSSNGAWQKVTSVECSAGNTIRIIIEKSNEGGTSCDGIFLTSHYKLTLMSAFGSALAQSGATTCSCPPIFAQGSVTTGANSCVPIENKTINWILQE